MAGHFRKITPTGMRFALAIALACSAGESVAAATCTCPSGWVATGSNEALYCKQIATSVTLLCFGVATLGGLLREPQAVETPPKTPVTGAVETPPKTPVTGAIETSQQTAVTAITQATANAAGQAGTIKAANDVKLTAAVHEANAAVLLCAEGANNELETANSGVGEMASCQDKFAKADALVEMTEKSDRYATLKRDEGMLGDANAMATLEKFQKNFGIDKDEYVNRMLAARGKRTELADMLGSRFNESQLDKMFTSGGESAPDDSKEAAVTEGGGVITGDSAAKAVKKDVSLRDSLKAKLEAASPRKPASVAGTKPDMSSIPAAHEKLQPAGLEPWIYGDKEEQETFLTIFDILHQKLEDLRRREKI